MTRKKTDWFVAISCILSIALPVWLEVSSHGGDRENASHVFLAFLALALFSRYAEKS